MLVQRHVFGVATLRHGTEPGDGDHDLSRLLTLPNDPNSFAPVRQIDVSTLDVASVALFAGVVRDHLAAGGAALIATHVDLGLPEAQVLDLDPYRTRILARDGFDEAFA